MIILGFDALDKAMVEKFGCKNLMQENYGQTDISGFALERTVVLWASFITGENLENEIPIETQWEFRLPKKRTMFRFFDRIETVDVPAFSLKLENHKKEHSLLAGYFKEKNTIEEFDELVWKNHEENKAEFMKVLENTFISDSGKNIVMGYFDLADAIGHLSFGDEEKMRKVYEELDCFVRDVRKLAKDLSETLMIVSDHGMFAVGRYGDHTKNGFYSFNKNVGVESTPNITDFFSMIENGDLR